MWIKFLVKLKLGKCEVILLKYLK